MKTVHSPGPWQSSGVRINGEFLLKAEKMLQVTCPTGAIAYIPYTDRVKGEAEMAHADQRIMAASLHLLDALKEFVHGYQSGTLTEAERNRNALDAISLATRGFTT
ncbi:hypothetical protein [Roseococcus pinisoli]|uniref:Uncharacterized protein n=1 Tax=Roseococcus pinisoli TaxID=2835040 RepID=A0ABS5QF14_9PROT|nr:hypothetical protein [Roseococcus pinisoli]MBS7812284.1 hypothetical protein [Roseococcus pinisoli]